MIEIIEKSFVKMTVTLRKNHTLLGIDIQFMEDRTAAINMKQYIKDFIEAFGEDIVKE